MPKKTKIFAIISVIICLALAISLAELFSSLITIGDFAFLPSGQAKSTGYNIYAISLCKEVSQASANERASQIKYQNGAGYVYKNDDNIYYVLASAYESENDANKVLEKITNDTGEAHILKIKVSDISINMSMSGKEKVAMNNALAIFKTTFKALYDLSISLDTEVKNQTECKLNIADIKANLTKVQADFDTHFNSKLNQNLLLIKLNLNNLNELLQQLLEESKTQSPPFSSLLKYSYIKTVMLNIDICDNLVW